MKTTIWNGISVLGILILIIGLTASCSKESGGSAGGNGVDGANVGVGGSTARFAIVGEFLYAVDQNDLNIFFLKNEKPSLQGKLNINERVETIFSREDLIFIGTSTGVYIYDTSNPTNPKRKGVFNHVLACDPVVADDKYAYATLRSIGSRCNRSVNQLDILDVSNPSNPTLINSFPMVAPKGLAITDTLLLVCDNGVKVFDRSTDPTNPVLVNYEELIEANDLIVIGDLVIVTSGKGIYQYRINGFELELISEIFAS